MPNSYIRLSAGREAQEDTFQTLCFFAGANSIFYGEKLLTTPNPRENADMELFERLGIHAEEHVEHKEAASAAAKKPAAKPPAKAKAKKATEAK